MPNTDSPRQACFFALSSDHRSAVMLNRRSSASLFTRLRDSLTELRAQSARHVQVSMNGQAKDPDAAKRLFELLKPYRNGPCPIVIAYERKDGRALLELPDEWRVQPSDEMLGGLRTWLSREGVRVVYA